MATLDYSLKTMQQRNALVTKIVQQAEPATLTPSYLRILSDYILDAQDNRRDWLDHKITTPNRLVTINARETSYEGLVGKLQRGENGIYSLMAHNARNTYLSPKKSITPQDIEQVPGLADLVDSIHTCQQRQKTATGRQKYLLKKQLIEMRQQQYTLKNSYRQPVFGRNIINTQTPISLTDNIAMDAEGRPHNNGPVSLFEPKHISQILCNYSRIKSQCADDPASEAWAFINDFDLLLASCLRESYPLYWDLVWLKIAGYTNLQIQSTLQQKHGIRHTVQYISSLWRNKIPKLIADYAEEQYIINYYTFVQKGTWKKCTRCGEVKLAHNRFFSRNSSSKDHFYSICKQCRNKKKKGGNS